LTSVDSTHYTAIFTPSTNTASGSASVGVSAGTYTGLGGNLGEGGTAVEMTFDTLAPTLKTTNPEDNGYLAAGNALVERLGDRAVFVSGATKAKDRQDEYDEVAEATGKIIVATYGVAAVGINIPRIFNLVLIEPGKSFVRVIQSIGRGIRKAEDKDHVQIWDITSTCKFAKRHLTKRKQFYKEANYPFSAEKLEWMKVG
jgi:hypothetical protein